MPHPHHRQEDSNIQEILPLLEQIVHAGKKLLIIAEDVEGDALDQPDRQQAPRRVHLRAVKAPGFGDRRKEMLQDIAILTGGTGHHRRAGSGAEGYHTCPSGPCTSGQGLQGEHHHCRRCRRARTLSSPESARSAPRSRTPLPTIDREKLQERLAKLAGGVAVIKVGAATETEMKEKKLRIEDALAATKAAVEEGSVAGGGVALLNAIRRCQGSA